MRRAVDYVMATIALKMLVYLWASRVPMHFGAPLSADLGCRRAITDGVSVQLPKFRRLGIGIVKRQNCGRRSTKLVMRFNHNSAPESKVIFK